jgi:hypothetical protein
MIRGKSVAAKTDRGGRPMLSKLSIGLVVSASLSTAAFAQGQFGIAAATKPTMSVQATETAARLAKGQNAAPRSLMAP